MRLYLPSKGNSWLKFRVFEQFLSKRSRRCSCVLYTYVCFCACLQNISRHSCLYNLTKSARMRRRRRRSCNRRTNQYTNKNTITALTKFQRTNNGFSLCQPNSSWANGVGGVHVFFTLKFVSLHVYKTYHDTRVFAIWQRAHEWNEEDSEVVSEGQMYQRKGAFLKNVN